MIYLKSYVFGKKNEYSILHCVTRPRMAIIWTVYRSLKCVTKSGFFYTPSYKTYRWHTVFILYITSRAQFQWCRSKRIIIMCFTSLFHRHQITWCNANLERVEKKMTPEFETRACFHYIELELEQLLQNEPDGVSNHKPHHCLPNRLFRRRSKKTSKLCLTGLFWGEFTGHSVNSPHKGPVTRKMFQFDDVIMKIYRNMWVQ